MKQLFFFLFSFVSFKAFSASCCVSNTSVSNLMLTQVKWQETLTLAQSRVIGDVSEKGISTFRNPENKETTQHLKLDLSYGWNSLYQSGISVKYQNKERQFNSKESSDSGWSDIGFSHAYQSQTFDRLWFFQTFNVPTATSVYNSNSAFAVDAHGSGTFQTALGFFGIENNKGWDYTYSSEIHHSFARNFKNNNSNTKVGDFWGASISGGIGYIPWRSKSRYGLMLSPRLESAKKVIIANERSSGRSSLVWDTSLNYTYTINAEYAIGLNYLDQTIIGPAKNTLLSRSFSFLFQTKWF
jgi:hypothetical protein